MDLFACVVGANCNSPILQFAHITIRPYCNSPTLQIAYVFNCPHVEGLIAISPLHVCFLDVRKYTCKYTKNIMGMV